jgi:hypothetical protein
MLKNPVGMKACFVDKIHGHFGQVCPASLTDVSAVIAGEIWWMNRE